MKLYALRLATIGCLVLAAACRNPVAPDPFVDFADGSTRAGYSVTMLSTSPPPQSTIDWHQGAAIANVRVAYERPSDGPRVGIWICLARDTSSFILSSCRETGATATKGEADGYASIYRHNDAAATDQTRYVLAFFIAGDDVVSQRKMYDDFEVGFNRLPKDVFASHRVEHPLRWR